MAEANSCAGIGCAGTGLCKTTLGSVVHLELAAALQMPG